MGQTQPLPDLTIPLGNPLNLREVVRPKLDPSTEVYVNKLVGLLLMSLPDFVVEATGYQIFKHLPFTALTTKNKLRFVANKTKFIPHS